jgi:putative ABC transport system permease protein
MVHDLRVAIRVLLKRPGFAVSVILTLALGIGASTMMFSLLDAAILRPLPFKESGRLVMLQGVAGPQRDIRGGSMLEVADWRSLNQTLTDVSVYDETSLNLTLDADAVRVDAEMVSAGYFALLGVSAVRGRTFLPEEDRVPGERSVALISDRLWRERFDGSDAVIGRTVLLNDRPATVVGVMPAGFAGLSFDTDVWFPSMMVSLTSSPGVVTSRGTRWLGALGQLRQGVSVAQAQDDLNRVAASLERQYPDTNRLRGVQVRPAKDAVLGSTGPLVVALFSAVLLLLTVACANVASLQLARTTGRRRELAVRLALGARSWHLLRQMLVESLVLAGLAGIAGALVAAWSTAVAVSLMPAGVLPRQVSPAVDPRALVFTAAIAVTVGALVAILPILVSRGRDVVGAIKEGARSSAAGLGSLRRLSTQQALVVGEIALAMTLLTGAGLMARSVHRQLQVSVGFDPAGVTAARLTLPGQRYTPEQRAVFVARLEEELERIPLVSSVAVGSDLPLTGNWGAATMASDAEPDQALRYYRHFTTPDYFATLGIPLAGGRAFTAQDRAGSPPVAIISQSGAGRLWRGADPIGRRIRLGTQQVEIVGVVRDARFRDLTSDITSASAEPDVFFPFAQRTDRDLEIAVRSVDGSAVPIGLLQRAVASADPAIPIYGVQRLDDAVAQQTSTSRFGAVLLAAFSGSALLLAAVGLYGLIAYVTGLSRREIAIRLALGANRGGIVALIVRNAMTLVVAGLVLGAAGAAAGAGVIEAQLFEIGRADPGTYAAVAAGLLMVATAASFLPAHRAARANPQTALRGE